MGEGKARPMARERIVKGSQTGMVRPAGLGPRTRSPAKTTRMRRLSFDFPIPGCWADLQKQEQACAGLSGPRARRCRAQTFAPCRPCASARAPLSSCTKGRHPHGPRQRPAGSGPAGRTRTWSRQGRATRNIGSAQKVGFPKFERFPDNNPWYRVLLNEDDRLARATAWPSIKATLQTDRAKNMQARLLLLTESNRQG